MAPPILTKGTDGGQNYLVLARSGDVALSMRPIAFNDNAREGKITLLVRIRAARFPGALVDLSGDDVLAAFPDFPFENYPRQSGNDPRCSVYCAIYTNQKNRLFLEKALEMQRFTSKFFEYLLKFVPAGSLVSDVSVLSDQIIAHIVSENVVGKVAAELAKTDETFAAAYEKLCENHANVLNELIADFKKQKKDMTASFLAATPELFEDIPEEDVGNTFDAVAKLIAYEEAEESYGDPDMPTAPAPVDPGYGTI